MICSKVNLVVIQELQKIFFLLECIAFIMLFRVILGNVIVKKNREGYETSNDVRL